MKLTEQDNEMFKLLSGSELGKRLVEYLRRLESHICDSRTWGENETRESANRLANLIETEVCDKIMLRNSKKVQSDKDSFI